MDDLGNVLNKPKLIKSALKCMVRICFLDLLRWSSVRKKIRIQKKIEHDSCSWSEHILVSYIRSLLQKPVQGLLLFI